MTAKEFVLTLLDEAAEVSNVQWHIAMIERAEADHHPHCPCRWCALGRALDGPSLSVERGKLKRQMLRPARVRVIHRRPSCSR